MNLRNMQIAEKGLAPFAFCWRFSKNDKNILKNDKKLLTNDNYCGKTTLKSIVLEENNMWNKSKSITLTHLLVRACYVFLAIAVMVLPNSLQHYKLEALGEVADYITYSFVAVVPAGYAALVCLDKLLINVKKGMVFNEKNVKLLRASSWLCFFAALVGAITFIIIFIRMQHVLGFISASSLLTLAILTLTIGEAFMGLVVRVVKNVFEAAIEIKEENELTI